MLTYNTQLERITLPEYGRTVQKMVEYCMTLPEKEQRNSCAAAIVRSIININPEIKNSPEDMDKLWDHLAIISGFKLDIDYPGEVLTAETLQTRPETVPYGRSNLRHRNYGRLLEAMIDFASTLEEGDEKRDMTECLANQMKKALVVATGEEIEDEKIFNDLAAMSKGAIRVSTDELRLRDYKPAPQPAGKKKKKK